MNRRVCIIFITIVFLILLSSTSLAGSISISSSKSTVSPGETFTVSVTGNDATGKVNVSGGSISPSSQWIENNSVKFSATAPQTGSVTITASGEFSDSQGNDFKDSKSITISVAQPTPPPSTPNPEPTTPATPTEPTKPAEPVVSSNANLSNLGINPKEYDFKGFRASKTTYEVTVPNEVNSIEIYASKQDSKASIEGIGKKKVQEGTNVFKIIVTAENGNTKTYQLNVIRQVAGSEIVPNSGDDVSDSTSESITMGLSKLELKGVQFTPEFKVDTYRYTIELENKEITTLDQIKELIAAEVNFEGGTFEISGDEKLEKEENEVVISVKDADGREIAIYTLVFKYPKVEDTANTADTSDTAMLITNIDEPFEINIDKLIILLSITIITIIAIISTINSYKQRKILKENGLIKEKQVYDEDEEEIIEESEEQVVESEVEQKEENKDYIEDIFKTSQMSFEADDKDFIKKKRGKGKHS